jgi:energy-coupling factor transporter ATP-binding protein EcfA2
MVYIYAKGITLNNARKVLNYWQRSVEDGDRLDFKEADINNYVELPTEEMEAGELSPSSFEKVDKKADWNKKGALDVLICPFPLFRKQKGQKERFYPLVIPARLEEDGSLHPQKDNPSFVPRKYLEPTDHSSHVVGQLAALEQYRKKHPHPEEGTWEMVWRDAEQLFKHVTGKKPDQFELQGFQPFQHAVVWFGKTASRAYRDVFYCYKDFSRQTKIPRLLCTYTGGNQGKKQIYLEGHHEYGTRHYGQMTDKYPLTPSQREALHHFFALEEGEILGVNGPPGTGKTTLIQSVVSSLWIQRALEEDEPPVILASSSNNLAVLNILDSFQKSVGAKPEAEELHPLVSRWIPKVNSYGLFCASKSKFQELQDQYPSVLRKYDKNTNKSELIGFHLDLEEENLPAQVDYFLQQCAQYFGEPLSDVSQAKQRLHRELTRVCETVAGRVSRFHERERLQQRLKDEFKSWEQLEQAISDASVAEEQSREKHQRWNEIYTDWLDAVEKRSLLRRLIGFLQVSANESFLRKKKVDDSFPSYTDADVKAILSRKESKAKEENDGHNQRLNELKELRNRLKELEAEWKEWKEHHWTKSSDYSPERAFFQELDTQWRYKAFLLATHYWEARWLEELESEDGPSVEHEEAIWRRFAKLTPCFVATMSSAPNFFRRFRKPGKYLYGFVDLLIIDEAGQVTPEQAGPVFALADRALVVGDTEQLQPISRLNQQVDEANLKTCGLLSEEEDFDRFSRSGLAASNGSVMKVAQQVSRYRKHKDLGGMLLTEHHRCVEDIIQYCNELCYQNRLDPCRKNPAPGEERYGDLPRLGYLHVEGTAESTGGSWKTTMKRPPSPGGFTE